LESARYNAENIYNLDPDRLVVENIWAGKGQYIKRLKIHARGRTGVMHHPHCHVTVVLQEVPIRDNERRLGRFGKTHKTLVRQRNNVDDNNIDVLNQQLTATSVRM